MHAEHDLYLGWVILRKKTFQILRQSGFSQMQGLQNGDGRIGRCHRTGGPHEAACQKGSRQGIACAEKRKPGKKAARPKE